MAAKVLYSGEEGGVAAYPWQARRGYGVSGNHLGSGFGGQGLRLELTQLLARQHHI